MMPTSSTSTGSPLYVVGNRLRRRDLVSRQLSFDEDLDCANADRSAAHHLLADPDALNVVLWNCAERSQYSSGPWLQVSR